VSVRERFVVGTGRCGSTLLSLLLAEHREVVSLHEFFTGLDWNERFRPGPVTGAELAAIVSAEQAVTTKVLGLGYTADEIRYPFDRPGATYVAGDPVPWLLITMVSRLTDDPEPLFAALLERAAAQPTQPLADHYRDLFDWLTHGQGGSVWIERSGSSVDYVGDLLALYPDARIVHLHRDGPETALSIRAHPFYRLALAILYDLFPGTGTEAEQIRHVVETPPPVEVAGRYWSDQIEHGVTALAGLPSDQRLDVRFEDLVADPVPVLTGIATFLELPDDDGFATRAAGLVHDRPALRLPRLSPAEQHALRDACRPGMALVGRPT
jgi:hypothetical protein